MLYLLDKLLRFFMCYHLIEFDSQSVTSLMSHCQLTPDIPSSKAKLVVYHTKNAALLSSNTHK
jgi:hypothetical protein